MCFFEVTSLKTNIISFSKWSPFWEHLHFPRCETGVVSKRNWNPTKQWNPYHLSRWCNFVIGQVLTWSRKKISPTPSPQKCDGKLALKCQFGDSFVPINIDVWIPLTNHELVIIPVYHGLDQTLATCTGSVFGLHLVVPEFQICYCSNQFIYGCFLKLWYPTTIGFPTKNDHFGVFWGYHHLRKPPYRDMCHLLYWVTIIDPSPRDQKGAWDHFLSNGRLIHQKFQVHKMEVLYLKRLFWGGFFLT